MALAVAIVHCAYRRGARVPRAFEQQLANEVDAVHDGAQRRRQVLQLPAVPLCCGVELGEAGTLRSGARDAARLRRRAGR